MNPSQQKTLAALQAKLRLSDGELLRIAQEFAHEVWSLNELTRAEVDRLIVRLDDLLLVGTR